jgi:hypothetical protein
MRSSGSLAWKDLLRFRNSNYAQRPKVIVSLTGGLGNQLFQIAAAYNLARPNRVEMEWDLGLPRLNSNQVPDITDFDLPDSFYLGEKRKPTNLQRKFFSTARRLSISSKKYTKLPGLGLIRKTASVLISQLVKYPVRFEAARGVGFSEIDISNTKTNFLTGYFQSYKWASDKNCSDSIKRITLKDPSPRIQELAARSLKYRPLVVHVRLGDYKNEKTFGIPSEEYYGFAIDLLWSTGDYDEIWVFSNEPDLATEYLPKKYETEYYWVDEIEGSASQTLEAMRFGHGYVIGNSTFSWWGAFLSRNENPKVVAPTPWFKNQESPIYLIPPHWSQMDARFS